MPTLNKYHIPNPLPYVPHAYIKKVQDSSPLCFVLSPIILNKYIKNPTPLYLSPMLNIKNQNNVQLPNYPSDLIAITNLPPNAMQFTKLPLCSKQSINHNSTKI